MFRTTFSKTKKKRVYFSLQHKYDLKTTLAQVKSMM